MEELLRVTLSGNEKQPTGICHNNRLIPYRELDEIELCQIRQIAVGLKCEVSEYLARSGGFVAAHTELDQCERS